MVFNSLTFLIFFLVFFLVYWSINNRFSLAWRNGFTLLASYIFYGWWDWRFLGLIIISSLADYLLGLSIGQTEDQRKRKGLIITSISINLGLLGFFKYYGFFVESASELLSYFALDIGKSSLNIILPVGISFYTFQTMSYTIDIYRKQLKPTKNPLTFFTFVAFFPQLVAGPIERASHLLQQFKERKTFSYELAVGGLRLVLWGFFKKIVIADNFGFLADSIFNSDQPLSGISVWMGATFFAIQIYGDFSGYSDIAIGISKMLGYDLMTNFKTPYFSKTFAEFWHRWHISLSTWFRDYVYIPLGGNRANKWRIHFNIFVTFLLSGLWHGANVTFLLWGGLHGFALILERQFYKPGFKFFYAPLVFLGIVLFWLPFRAVDVSHVLDYVAAVVDIQNYSFGQFFELVADFPFRRLVVLGFVAICFFVFEYLFNGKNIDEWLCQKRKRTRWMVYYCLILLLLILGNFSVKPNFIYFQF